MRKRGMGRDSGGGSLREAIEKRQHAYEEEKRKERQLQRDPSPETLRNRTNTGTPMALKQRLANLRTPQQEDLENRPGGGERTGVIPRTVW